MDRASSLIYPGSRTLAGWWRQLAARQPLALLIGYAFVHRIEAPVYVLAEQPIDPLFRHVLQALALEEAGVRLANLQERLRLPVAVVQRVLADMQAAGLIGCAAELWQLSERGGYALQHGSVPVRSAKRRIFPFWERLDPTGQRVAPPQFMPIAECVGVSWPVDEPHRFDPAHLAACLEQQIEARQASVFPLDVEPLAEDARLETWQQVIVDRPERVMVVLTLVNVEGNREVQGFPVKVDGWTLFEHTPILRLPALSDGLWPELTQPISMPIWQEAWRAWCKQRQLPANEVDACVLTHQGPRLDVQAPTRLVQRLQAAKSDLFKGEAWLLVGDGYLRTAVQLTMRGV